MAETEAKSQLEQTGQAKGCPVRMSGLNPCGRPIYIAPSGADKEPVCLMHSRDPKKDDAAFQREFQRILQEAGDGVADFSRFVFPSPRYSYYEFKPMCIFEEATFTKNADFSGATFTEDADFRSARFTQRAHFGLASFTQDAHFGDATFTQGANFTGATFTQEAVFFDATFTQGADFTGATFTQEAVFFDATFTQGADFTGATFTKNADFCDATFTQDAVFFDATFTQGANFTGATFTQGANFSRTTFTQGVYFESTRFSGAVEFHGTVFRGGPTPYPDAQAARGVAQEKDPPPGPVFSFAEFERPELVTFYQTYLGLGLFHNCDVSRFVFSDVRWRERKNHKSMAFDEVVPLEHGAARSLRTTINDHEHRNYRLIAELYQQLKKNYDDRRDYWTAGDFHYGEMEMKRLSSRRKNPVVRWLHRHLGLVALYGYASEYGESYVRPARFLLFFLFLLFPAIYGVIGLRPTSSGGAGAGDRLTLSFSTYIHLAETQSPGKPFTAWPLLSNCVRTSVDVALLRPQLAYEPAGFTGWLASRLEFVLTSTSLALFLLALRRQFRR